MASINSVSGNNMTSSLYNSSNIISGLASGLDTEGMIEGLVQSYQTKIQNLTNKATKLEWKQEAYRSIISKMYAFSNKYTSYSSASNLMSKSFFTSAVKVAALGANADKVAASGRTDSSVKLNSVKQLATAARYNTQSNLKGVRDDNGEFDFAITADKAVKFTDEFDTGALSGSLSLKYGDKTVSVVFDPNTDIIEDKVYKTDANGEYVMKDGKREVLRERTAAEKASDLQKLIEKKLSSDTITLSNGESRKANELIDVKLSGSSISFKDKSTGGNSLYIASASDSVKNTLGLDLDNAEEDKPASFNITNKTRMVKTSELGNYISGMSMNVSLDGKTKTIQLPTIRSSYDGYMIQGEDGQYTKMTSEDYVKAVQTALDKEFGVGKLTVSNESGSDDSLKLRIKAPDHSDLIINTDAGKALGIGNASTNYLNTSKTLGDLMEKDAWDGLTAAKGVGGATKKDGKLYDALGRQVNDKGNLIDDDGNELYAFKINGVTVGNYGKGTKLSTIINDVNNSAANVKLTYSQTTRQFSFVSKDTGAENKIELGDGLAQTMFGAGKSASGNFSQAYNVNLADGEKQKIYFSTPAADLALNVTNKTTTKEIADKLNEVLKAAGYTATYHESTGQLLVTDDTGKKIDMKMTMGSENGDELKPDFKSTYTPGQDAVFTVEVNGQEMEMIRGSNNANIDGMTLSFKDTFNENHKVGEKLETEAVTFNTSTDSDKLVDAIKSMVSDYNEMMAEIKSAFGTLPYQDSSGAFKSYEPLSDEDKATMSESAIQAYEAKAKQGLLFNDYNLSSLYERMLGIFSPGGQDGALLRQMGITWSYSSDGTSYVALDENKLRDMLNNDVDAVADVFTRSVNTGAGSNGIMQSMKVQLDRYAGTTGAVKGILVQQAGTPLSSLTLMNNEWQRQIDELGNQITKWQDKLSAQVDKYTSMFSKLETLIYQMNSQSSTLAGMMGGGGY